MDFKQNKYQFESYLAFYFFDKIFTPIINTKSPANIPATIPTTLLLENVGEGSFKLGIYV